MKESQIGCIANDTDKAQEKLRNLLEQYKFVDLANEDHDDINKVIVLGGDGFMLQVLHDYLDRGLEFYGVNCGTVGFLMNEADEDTIIEKLETAKATTLYPLELHATAKDGTTHKRLAINEVSVLRETYQTAKIKISVDGAERISSLACDGVLLSTPAGSTAYNSAVNGPILPLDSNILALTPISPFRPRNWKGALLPHSSQVTIEVLSPERRPVSAVADFYEVRDVERVVIKQVHDKPLKVLFDADHSLEERIIKEQFIN